jgi:arylsulfatase A-like enzyme
MLAAVDEAIGQILQSLEKSGIRDNTLIVFSSDNGAPQPGDNTPLRDFKATVYEGGIRGASFVNWPGRVSAQQRIKEPMHIVDWYPTLIGLAGGSLKQTLPMDGLNVWPMITQHQASPHDAILSVSNRGTSLSAIRMGNWKLIELEMTGIAAGSKISNRYEPVALFNLAEDPSEKKNLAMQYPDKVLLLQTRLKQMLANAVPSITKENAVE